MLNQEIFFLMRYGLNMVLRQKGNGQFFRAAQESLHHGSSLVADGKQFGVGQLPGLV